MKEQQDKKLQELRQDVAVSKKEKEKDAKELVEVLESIGNMEGQLETRKNPSKFATMVVKPSGSGLGGSVEPTFVECDAKGINVFAADGKIDFSVSRGEIPKHKKWLALVQRVAKEAPFRTWWSTAGSTIEATFVKREGSIVILRKRDGKEMPVQTTQLKPRSKSVIRHIEVIRKANPDRPDPVARYVIFLVRTKGISSWSAARKTCRDRMCKNGKIPLDGEGKLDLSMF